MHYVLEVQTLFYKDMLIQIWKVINIAGEVVFFYYRWNENNLHFETTTS
jgi:hypothetical protein